MKGPVDQHGVPVLNRQDIDARAVRFVKFFYPEVLERPARTPLLSICNELEARYEVAVRFDVDLGKDSAGTKILGRFSLENRCIDIDATLGPDDPRRPFTIAHELGHLVLHRQMDPGTVATILSGGFEDSAERFLRIRHSRGYGPDDWLEWQANQFAAALLLPAKTVPVALVERQIQRGITRGRGKVFVDWRKRATGDLNEMKSHLAALYGVSRTLVEIRLRELDLLNEEKPPNTTLHISEFFR